jgi:hypothetical protein
MEEPGTWTATVAGGGELTQEIEQSLDQLCRFLHVTNIALGPKATDGPHTIAAIVNGEETVLCTLLRGLPGHRQHCMDALFDATVLFRNYGSSPVSISGYWAVSVEDEEEEEMLMLSDDEESEDSDDEVPMAVPIVSTHAYPERGRERGGRDLASSMAEAHDLAWRLHGPEWHVPSSDLL